MASVTQDPAFSPKMFYKLINPNLPDSSLSAGIFQDSQGAINLTTDGSLSSENWQLFAQSGRYFIRNYDYGAGYQLGLTESSRSTPKLYPRSGKVEQQWSIVSVDGGWTFVNGLWGNGTTLNLPKGWFMPGMGSGNGGEVWRVESNPSAATAKPLSGEWVGEVSGFEVLAPSPSPTPSLVTGVERASTSTPRSTAVISTTSPPVPSFSSSPSPAPLSSAAIAGIAIGSVAAIGALILGIWFLLMWRKRRAAEANPYELHGEPRLVGETEKYAYRAELQQPIPELAGKRETAEMGGVTDAVVHRVELEGDLGKSREQQR